MTNVPLLKIYEKCYQWVEFIPQHPSCFVSKGDNQPLTFCLNTLPALNTGTCAAGIFNGSPVEGLRPVRALRFLASKEPKPINTTLSPAATAPMMTSTVALNIASASFFVTPVFSAIAAISSVLFIDAESLHYLVRPDILAGVAAFEHHLRESLYFFQLETYAGWLATRHGKPNRPSIAPKHPMT